jgi:hypothetical protein
VIARNKGSPAAAASFTVTGLDHVMDPSKKAVVSVWLWMTQAA